MRAAVNTACIRVANRTETLRARLPATLLPAARAETATSSRRLRNLPVAACPPLGHDSALRYARHCQMLWRTCLCLPLCPESAQ